MRALTIRNMKSRATKPNMSPCTRAERCDCYRVEHARSVVDGACILHHRPRHAASQDLVDLLRSVEVTLLADVRAVPRSRTNPHYNRDTLPHSLAACGIGYEHLAALGGLRGRMRELAPDVNAFWENESFHNYADYAMTDGFRAGLAHLRKLGEKERCAIMC